MPMPSSIASSTTRTASASPATACDTPASTKLPSNDSPANRPQAAHSLWRHLQGALARGLLRPAALPIDHPTTECKKLLRQRGAGPGRHHLRHHLGMPGRLRRNPQKCGHLRIPRLSGCPRRPLGAVDCLVAIIRTSRPQRCSRPLARDMSVSS